MYDYICVLLTTGVADNGYNPDNPGMNLSGLGGVGIVPQGVPGKL